MELNTCNICLEVINKRRTEVICGPCGFSACSVCFQRYLMDLDGPPQCMNCKVHMSLQKVESETTASFYAKYHKRRIDLEFERQKLLLPETQRIMVITDKIADIDKQIQNLENSIADIDLVYKDYKEQKKKEGKYNAIYEIEYYNSIEVIYFLKTFKEKEKNSLVDELNQTKTNVFSACKQADCNGFISNMVCMLCKTRVCESCDEIILEGHTCNPELVSSLKTIKQETKPCPGCGIRIYKISGCDQMWCVDCKTSFSWKTGLKETGVVHNPHYYEWQRQVNGGVAPRVPGDNPHGNVDFEKALQAYTKSSIYYDPENKLHYNVEKFTNFYNFANIFALRHLQINTLADINTNENMAMYRQLFVKHASYTEKKWKAAVSKEYKQLEFNTELIVLMDSIISNITDIVNSANQLDYSMDLAMGSIRDYGNNLFASLCERYKYKQKAYINEDWSYTI